MYIGCIGVNFLCVARAGVAPRYHQGSSPPPASRKTLKTIPKNRKTVNRKLFFSWFEGVPGSQGKSQKEGQEDQVTLKQLGGIPP